MLALRIIDIKDFMNKLLIGEVFDHFSFIESSITTFNTFTINGKLQHDFFDTDTKSALLEKSAEYSLWHDVKPFCFSVIRGKRTPLNFKIVFELSHEQVQSLLRNESLPSDIPVRNFYLNIQYKNQALLCTTGVSYTSFSLDKRLDISGMILWSLFSPVIIFPVRNYKRPYYLLPVPALAEQYR